MMETSGKHLEPEYSRFKMTRLSNSIYYYFDLVLLVEDEGGSGYRLIIHHDDKTIVDDHYATLRGGKIAFTKYCQRRAYTEEVKADWTKLYFPEQWWLEKILTRAKEIKCEG